MRIMLFRILNVQSIPSWKQHQLILLQMDNNLLMKSIRTSMLKNNANKKPPLFVGLRMAPLAMFQSCHSGPLPQL